MRFYCKLFAVIMLVTAVFTFCGCKEKEEITSYEITCELNGDLLSGREKITVYNGYENALDELKFNLFANAFRKNAKFSPVSEQYTSNAYYKGVNYGYVTVKGVTDGEGELSFSVCGEDENILSVKLKETLFPDETTTVYIDYELKLAQVISRTGIGKHSVNLANFYPILCAYDNGTGFYECVYYANGDPYYSECANYTVKFTCDSNYVVASSGYPTASAEKDGKRTTTYKIESARSFAFSLSPEFDVLTAKVGQTEINYYYYSDESPKKSLKYATESLELFNSKYGEYPYKTYSVVQTGFIQGGMEFPALVYISDELESKAYGEVIVHETAHQWWQTAVGNNEIEYGFLDEGLAEYSVVVFYEKYPEYGYSRSGLIKSSETTYKIFCSVSDKLFGKTNTVMLRGLKDFESEYEYVNVAYVKSCIMYDTFRTTIGDEKFFSGLKKYYREYKYKNATPDCLIAVYQSIGVDADGFFDSFFNGKVIL